MPEKTKNRCKDAAKCKRVYCCRQGRPKTFTRGYMNIFWDAAGGQANWQTGWKAGWQSSWQTGWKAGWQACWMAGWQASWQACWKAGWQVN